MKQAALVAEPDVGRRRAALREDVRQLGQHTMELAILFKDFGVGERLGRKDERVESSTNRFGSSDLSNLERGVGVDVERLRCGSAPVGA